MARIDFITLETYGSGAPVDLELVTYRYTRREDSERERLQASDSLRQVVMNYQLPMHKSYRYQRGISIALVEPSSRRALDGWKWVDELPTERNGRPSRAYLEFRDGSRLLKLLYRVTLGAHNEEARQSEDYDVPEPNDVPRCRPGESDSPHLTCDDGLVIEYPQPHDVGLQALLYNFGIDDAELQPAHERYLRDRVADLLRRGHKIHLYGLADRSFENRRRSRDSRRDHNVDLSDHRAHAVVDYLDNMLDDESWSEESWSYEGEVPAERWGDDEFEENPFFRSVYLEVLAPVVPQTGLIVTAIDSSVERVGRPIEQARVSIMVRQEDDTQVVVAQDMTESDGRALFMELAPGRYDVASDKEGYAPANTLEQVVLRSGEITHVTLEMPRRLDPWVGIRFDVEVTETGGDRIIDTDALGRDANGEPRFEGVPGLSEAHARQPRGVRLRIQAHREQSEEIQRSFAPDLPLLAVRLAQIQRFELPCLHCQRSKKLVDKPRPDFQESSTRRC